MTIFGDRALKEGIRLNAPTKVGPIGLMSLYKEDTSSLSLCLLNHTEDMLYEDTKEVRRKVSSETNTDGTLILDFSLQNHEKINFNCLSHLVCGILLWQSELTIAINN